MTRRRRRRAPGGVLLLHGWCGSPGAYAEAADAIGEATGLPVCAHPLPGHAGRAPGPRDARTVAALAVDAEQALAEVPGPALVVGHSLGGGVAIALAARCPERVAGLVLASPVGGGDGGWRAWARMAVGAGQEARAAGQALAREQLDAMADAWRYPVAAAQVGIHAKRVDLVGPLAGAVAAGVPVTLLLASEDRVVDPGALLGVPGVRVREVPGAHGWVLGEPGRFAELVADASGS